jgi:hypothetical protein
MEKALAAIHQANHERWPITLEYSSQAGRVGLYVEFPDHFEEFVTGPIAANYPNCSLDAVTDEVCPPGWQTWSVELELVPELFPILRHAQFEDSLNGTFADPINNILRAILPDEAVRCPPRQFLAPSPCGPCCEADGSRVLSPSPRTGPVLRPAYHGPPGLAVRVVSGIARQRHAHSTP